MLFLSLKCPVLLGKSRAFLPTLSLLVLLAFACSDSTPTEPTFVAADFSVAAEPEQLRVSGATPGSELALFDSDGVMVKAQWHRRRI